MSEQAERLTTTINVKKWLIKMSLFMVACFVLGVWGLYDAKVAYPARGREHEEATRLVYLKKLSETGLIFSDHVDDPARALAELERKPASELTEVERARMHWLTSLSRIENLSEITRRNQAAGSPPTKDTPTLFVDPAKSMQDLDAKLASRTQQPVPLNAYDIPVQWVFVVLGFGLGVYLVWLILATSRKKFHYVPSEHRLIMPDGREIVPSDVKEVDKRKWHKYYSSFILNDGTVVEFDLLRHVPLEEWFLEMEKLTPNYVPPPPEEEEGEEEAKAETANEGAGGT
ncbi:MAG TPA: hypothetical protein VG797_09145 [Phycisphaerales bacterium]|nr:hypothetical protein [Phycisphaerales bacterium]